MSAGNSSSRGAAVFISAAVKRRNTYRFTFRRLASALVRRDVLAADQITGFDVLLEASIVAGRSARTGASGSSGSGVVIRVSQVATSRWKLAGKAVSGSM